MFVFQLISFLNRIIILKIGLWIGKREIYYIECRNKNKRKSEYDEFILTAGKMVHKKCLPRIKYDGNRKWIEK